MSSLRRYLLWRLGSIVALVTLLMVGLMVYVLFYSHDDSAEYYMQYEALTLTEHYQVDALIEEFDPQVKEYYWRQSQLPDVIQAFIDKDGVIINKLNWYQNERFDIYVYPHAIDDLQTFWVVHYLLRDDLGEGFYFSRNLLLAFVLVAVALLLVAVVLISVEINKQLDGFSSWVANLDDNNCQAPEYKFSELQQAAFKLADSIATERQLQQQQQQFVTREKAFLSTLSHELRTPMAVSNTAIALLNKRGDLSQKDGSTLTKLATANDKMKLLSTCLLALWRKTPQDDNQPLVAIGEVVAQAIDSAQQANPVNVEISSAEQSWQTITVDGSLLQLLLDNLLRNASQYSGDGKAQLQLSFNQQQLQSVVVINSISTEQSTQGYGLGLYLVEEICQQQQWQLQTQVSDGQFTATVTLSIQRV